MTSHKSKARSQQPKINKARGVPFLMVAALLLTPFEAWPQNAPAAGTPVLLITVDTLRPDRLGCYGARRVATPTMDALAADGVRFETAYAQVPITLPSHAVILTGTYPMYNGVRDFTSMGIPPNVGLLAEAFQRQGYATAAFVSAFVLDSTWGFGRGFDTYDDHFDPRQFETRNPGNIQRRADETIERLLTWLRARHSSEQARKPFFVWLHLFDPHSDYNPPQPFRSQYAGRLYDGEVAYTDSQIARVFDHLRKRGLYDRALIVLLSDHGESLGEHGEDEHGFFIYNSTLRVPMIVKPPRGVTGPRVVPQPVGTIDVAPTLVELARLRDPLSRQFQGTSLASLVLGESATADRPVYAETYYPRNSFGWAPLRSVSSRRFHFVEAPRPEIYDLAADAGETHNLIGQRRAEAEALRAQLQDIERRYSAPMAAANGPPLSPDTLEKLKSLGYMAYSAPSTASATGPQLDPKDKITTLNQILRASDLTKLRRYNEADGLLAKLEQAEPQLYVLPFQRGENHLAWNKPQEALTEFVKTLNLNPTFDQASLGLGRAYFLLGKDKEAATALEVALRLNPRNFRARLALAKVYWRQDMLAQAEAELVQVTKLHPDFAEAHATYGIVLAKLGKYGEALPQIQRGVELGYRDAIAYNYLGVTHSQLGETMKAIRAYEEAVALNPRYAAAFINLALQYSKLNQPDRARSYYRQACESSDELCRQYAPQFASQK